jgi:hypothetical protein
MVGLGEVAPGVSLELRASGNNVEKLFQVAPGADARGIRVRIDGAETLSLAADGSLVVGTGWECSSPRRSPTTRRRAHHDPSQIKRPPRGGFRAPTIPPCR